MEPTPQQFQDRARALEARLGPQLEQARASLSDLNHRVSGFIRERPGTSLLIALGAGYLVGRLVSRR